VFLRRPGFLKWTTPRDAFILPAYLD
jgi:hypothetical protein